METLHDEYIRTISKFNNDKNLIIQSFINFYGEQYKPHILKTLNNLRILWYDDKNYKENEDIHNYIISSLPVEELDELLKKRNIKTFIQSSYIDELDLLVLPLSYDLTQIIHESNHKVSSHILSFEPLEQIAGVSFSKETINGVIVYNEFLNEAINQKMTLEILDELEEQGIHIEKTPSWQEHLFPLINYFYETFKNLLKETYISGNLTNFINLVGEDNYNYFSEIIYLKSFKIIRKLKKGDKPNISKEDIEMIEEIVNKMKLHYEETTDTKFKKNK